MKNIVYPIKARLSGTDRPSDAFYYYALGEKEGNLTVVSSGHMSPENLGESLYKGAGLCSSTFFVRTPTVNEMAFFDRNGPEADVTIKEIHRLRDDEYHSFLRGVKEGAVKSLKTQ